MSSETGKPGDRRGARGKSFPVERHIFVQKQITHAITDTGRNLPDISSGPKPPGDDGREKTNPLKLETQDLIGRRQTFQEEIQNHPSLMQICKDTGQKPGVIARGVSLISAETPQDLRTLVMRDLTDIRYSGRPHATHIIDGTPPDPYFLRLYKEGRWDQRTNEARSVLGRDIVHHLKEITLDNGADFDGARREAAILMAQLEHITGHSGGTESPLNENLSTIRTVTEKALGIDYSEKPEIIAAGPDFDARLTKARETINARFQEDPSLKEIWANVSASRDYILSGASLVLAAEDPSELRALIDGDLASKKSTAGNFSKPLFDGTEPDEEILRAYSQSEPQTFAAGEYMPDRDEEIAIGRHIVRRLQTLPVTNANFADMRKRAASLLAQLNVVTYGQSREQSHQNLMARMKTVSWLSSKAVEIGSPHENTSGKRTVGADRLTSSIDDLLKENEAYLASLK